MKDLHLQSAREDGSFGLVNLRVHGMAESPSMIEYSREVLAGLETDLPSIPNQAVGRHSATIALVVPEEATW